MCPKTGGRKNPRQKDFLGLFFCFKVATEFLMHLKQQVEGEAGRMSFVASRRTSQKPVKKITKKHSTKGAQATKKQEETKNVEVLQLHFMLHCLFSLLSDFTFSYTEG
jgi:hypothetical protein